MRTKLSNRVAHLEKLYEWQLLAAHHSEVDTSATLSRLKQLLAAEGFEQETAESLAETMGRAFGITSDELKDCLDDAANGLIPALE